MASNFTDPLLPTVGLCSWKILSMAISLPQGTQHVYIPSSTEYVQHGCSNYLTREKFPQVSTQLHDWERRRNWSTKNVPYIPQELNLLSVWLLYPNHRDRHSWTYWWELALLLHYTWFQKFITASLIRSLLIKYKDPCCINNIVTVPWYVSILNHHCHVSMLYFQVLDY